MTVDDRPDEDDWVPPDQDDLGRAFGPDTESVAVRPLSQRVRTWSLVGAGVVLVAAIVAGALWFLVDGVQTGIGGVFAKPATASSAFRSTAAELDGVTETTELRTRQTTFASYDVVEIVTTEDSLDTAAQERLVDALSDAAQSASGNGVHVYAIARIGDLRVGISPSRTTSGHRLGLARQLDAIGGVRTVTCDWTGDGEGGAVRDTDAGQRIVVGTPATGGPLGAIEAVVQQRVTPVFPHADVRVESSAAG